MRSTSVARTNDVVMPRKREPDFDGMDKSDIDVLHEIGSRIAAADPLHDVLSRVVQFVSSIVPCDSCFIYVWRKTRSSCEPRRRHTLMSSIG